MHSRQTVESALELSRSGRNAGEIGALIGVPRRTVSDWLVGIVPSCARRDACPHCHATHDLSALPSAYVHLLGLYLGDGYLAPHPRAVFKLRLILDRRYPQLIQEAVDSVREVCGRAALLARADNCVEVYAFSRSWICLLPQHGRGKKHHRPIVLTPWQLRLVDRWPEQLLRGLVQSDGCRFQNTGRGGWSAPRYAFSNRSADIHGIFRAACDRLGVAWTNAGDNTTYVSRKADVATLDRFIGPKR